MRLKNTVLFTLILIFSCISAETIKFATWNIRKFSRTSRVDFEREQIAKIAIQFDFLAVQELLDSQAAFELRSNMEALSGRKFDLQVSSEVGDIQKERYAFIWDASKIKQTVRGRLYNDNFFLRKPFYGSFKAGNFDFLVITHHTKFGNRVDDRRQEVIRLGQVFEKIQERDPDENDIILCGDFNRPPRDEKSWFRIQETENGIMPSFLEPDKSVIFDSDLLDNIWFQLDFVKEYTFTFTIDKFDERVYNNDDQLASLEVSDHRPLMVEFEISGSDDDGEDAESSQSE